MAKISQKLEKQAQKQRAKKNYRRSRKIKLKRHAEIMSDEAAAATTARKKWHNNESRERL